MTVNPNFPPFEVWQSRHKFKCQMRSVTRSMNGMAKALINYGNALGKASKALAGFAQTANKIKVKHEVKNR